MTSQQSIQIRIDSETGCATATISAPGGGTPITIETLESACKEAGVELTEGVRAQLTELVSQCATDPRPIDRIIAQPIPSVDGTDGYIEWCDVFDPTPKGSHSEQGDRVDHYAGRTFIHVAAQTKVGTLHAPTPGTDGRTVTGQPLKASPGSPCPLRIGSSLNVDGEGNIISPSEGVLSVKNDLIEVSKLLEVREHVDFSTGHIDFDGCVDIREEVRDLFKINATGSVSVGELIEAATIICGGDFIGRRGMSGKGRGTLTVKGDAEIGFLNDAKVNIGGTLSVRREIINCETLVEGELVAESCTLIGGMLDLRGRGVIGMIGSGSNRPTRIVLTKDANLLIAKGIHPNVSFQLGRTIHEIDRMTKGPVRIVVTEEHGLAYRIADGVPRPMNEIARTLREAA